MNGIRMPTKVRPQFAGWIAVLAGLPIKLFMTIWAGGFFGGLSGAAFGQNSRAPFVFCGLLAFIGIPCFAYFGRKEPAR